MVVQPQLKKILLSGKLFKKGIESKIIKKKIGSEVN